MRTRSLKSPHTIDIEINGVCNLACPWCWGPVHDKSIETISNEQWIKLIAKLKKYGTKSIVFTGGEPLLRTGLIDILSAAKSEQIRVTLSTNGTFLTKLKELLIYLDDLGLPLDGHSQEINQLMRGNTIAAKLHFEQVLKTLVYVQENAKKNTQLTIRTVISNKNKLSVPLIGKTLQAAGVNANRFRWKLYQVTPIDPRYSVTKTGDWLISEAGFLKVVKQTRANNPTFNIEPFLMSHQSNRYVFIDPKGDTYLVGCIDDYPSRVFAGNILKDFEKTLNIINFHGFSPDKSTHGL